MIGYISQLVTTLGAVIGVMLSPKETIDGKTTYKPWIWIFITLPMLTGAISVYELRQKEIEAETAESAQAAAAQSEAKARSDLAAAKKAAEESLAIAAAEQRESARRELESSARERELIVREREARIELAKVGFNTERSLKLVSYFETELHLEAPLNELGLSEAVRKEMTGYLTLYTTPFDEDGKRTYGFTSTMFNNWRQASEDEKIIYAGIERAAQRFTGAQGATLFVAPPSAKPLASYVSEALKANIVSANISTDELPRGVYAYPISNPRQNKPLPFLPTLAAEDAWIVPNKDDPKPKIVMIWRNRVLIDRSSPHQTSDDYKAAQLVAYVPRPNPDQDDAPMLGHFGEAFGEPRRLQVDIGGNRWRWRGDKNDPLIVVRITGKSAPRVVGYVLTLTRI